MRSIIAFAHLLYTFPHFGPDVGDGERARNEVSVVYCRRRLFADRRRGRMRRRVCGPDHGAGGKEKQHRCNQEAMPAGCDRPPGRCRSHVTFLDAGRYLPRPPKAESAEARRPSRGWLNAGERHTHRERCLSRQREAKCAVGTFGALVVPARSLWRTGARWEWRHGCARVRSVATGSRIASAGSSLFVARVRRRHMSLVSPPAAEERRSRERRS